MAVASRVESIAEDIRLILSEDLSPIAQSMALVVQAQSALVEAKAINRSVLGYDPTYRTTVDGAALVWLGLRALSQVRPLSVISFEFNIWGDLIPFALQSLIDHSPEQSGRYRKSWFAMVDGHRVPDVKDIPPGSDVILVNDQPYSRKIDTGHMRMSVPPGVVEAARQDILSRYGNSVDVERIMMPLPGGYVLKGSFRKGYGTHARTRLQRDTRAGAVMMYPALAITPRA